MDKHQEVKLTHSGILVVKGRRHVSVRFERGGDIAEGSLPECKITNNSGFSEEEIQGLEHYLELNCDEIFVKAKEINHIKNWF